MVKLFSVQTFYLGFVAILWTESSTSHVDYFVCPMFERVTISKELYFFFIQFNLYSSCKDDHIISQQTACLEYIVEN